jgi:hypothetical protein
MLTRVPKNCPTGFVSLGVRRFGLCEYSATMHFFFSQTTAYRGRSFALLASRQSRKFLIPGLWDMHVHLSGATDLEAQLFVANGVTQHSRDGRQPSDDRLAAAQDRSYTISQRAKRTRNRASYFTLDCTRPLSSSRIVKSCLRLVIRTSQSDSAEPKVSARRYNLNRAGAPVVRRYQPLAASTTERRIIGNLLSTAGTEDHR